MIYLKIPLYSTSKYQHPLTCSQLFHLLQICTVGPTNRQHFSIHPPLFEETPLMKWRWVQRCGYTVPLIEQFFVCIFSYTCRSYSGSLNDRGSGACHMLKVVDKLSQVIVQHEKFCCDRWHWFLWQQSDHTPGSVLCVTTSLTTSSLLKCRGRLLAGIFHIV